MINFYKKSSPAPMLEQGVAEFVYFGGMSIRSVLALGYKHRGMSHKLCAHPVAKIGSEWRHDPWKQQHSIETGIEDRIRDLKGISVGDILVCQRDGQTLSSGKMPHAIFIGLAWPARGTEVNLGTVGVDADYAAGIGAKLNDDILLIGALA